MAIDWNNSSNAEYWWDQLNGPQFACPCYLHTFQAGSFSWTNYLKQSGGPLYSDGIIETCNYFDIVNPYTGKHWNIRSDEDSYITAFGMQPVFPEGIWRAESTQFEGATQAKDETLLLAPGLVLQNGIEYTIKVQLNTTRYCSGDGDCTAPGHKVQLRLAKRNDANVSGRHKGFPYNGITGEAMVLSAANFATAANAAVTDADCCVGLGANEFATNGELIEVDGTYTPSEDGIWYVGIQDTTPTFTADEGESTLTIYNVTVEPASYPILQPTYNQPNLTASITADDGTTNGAIDITGLTEAEYLYCWGDTYAIEAASPDRTNLSSGWYALKAVNIATGFHMPIELFYVPFFKSGTLSSPNNIWTEEKFVIKGNKMQNLIENGMDSSFLNLMKIDIIKYLWDKNDTDCLTDARKANFEKVLLNEFNTCAPPILSQYPEIAALNIVNAADLQAQEMEEWQEAGAMIWNAGAPSKPTVNRECCTGRVDYIAPAYVYHKGNIWRTRSIFSNTKTEPGSPLGQGNWEKAKKKKGVSGLLTKKYFEFQRKKSIFELEEEELTGYWPVQMYKGGYSTYLELENREFVTPENKGNMNYII